MNLSGAKGIIGLFVYVLPLIIFQMLGCRTRGCSFTRALLGISADEIHVCGDAAAVPLIQDILSVTGDHLEVIFFPYQKIFEVNFLVGLD